MFTSDDMRLTCRMQRMALQVAFYPTKSWFRGVLIDTTLIMQKIRMKCHIPMLLNDKALMRILGIFSN